MRVGKKKRFRSPLEDVRPGRGARKALLSSTWAIWQRSKRPTTRLCSPYPVLPDGTSTPGGLSEVGRAPARVGRGIPGRQTPPPIANQVDARRRSWSHFARIPRPVMVKTGPAREVLYDRLPFAFFASPPGLIMINTPARDGPGALAAASADMRQCG